MLLLLGGMRRYSGHFHVDAFRGARATFCSRAGVAVCRCCCGWSSMGHDDDGKGERAQGRRWNPFLSSPFSRLDGVVEEKQWRLMLLLCRLRLNVQGAADSLSSSFQFVQGPSSSLPVPSRAEMKKKREKGKRKKGKKTRCERIPFRFEKTRFVKWRCESVRCCGREA